MLPVIIGRSVLAGSDRQTANPSYKRPFIIAASLAVSVIVFTLVLKATTALLGVPQFVWQIISGVIVILLGVHFLFPSVWEHVALKTGLHLGSNKFLGKTFGHEGVSGDILTGLALGPVFSSCSPTYALIVATVLPASFIKGLIYLSTYAIGMAGTLLLIAFAGQAAATKLGWLSNPYGWFRRVIGILFIVVGFSVIFGLDKKFQTYVLDRGWYDPISRFEQSIEN